MLAQLRVEQDFIDTQEGTWVQTSYNTHGGQHSQGRTPLRKNYAGTGGSGSAAGTAPGGGGGSVGSGSSGAGAVGSVRVYHV